MSDTAPAGFPGTVEAVAIAVTWVAEEVDQRSAQARQLEVPLLLTLPESNGAEIVEVLRRGLVRKTESETAVRDEDAGLIVALPRTMPHRSHLQRIIAGFSITTDTEFSNLLGKAEEMPDGRYALQCRSAFVNFDRADFSVNHSGSVKAFSEIARVCNLHSSHSSDWGLCFWADAGGLAMLAKSAPFDVLEGALAEDAEQAKRAYEWCGNPVNLTPNDRKLLVSLGKTLLCLGLGLRDEGWSISVTRIGLVDRDTADRPTCGLVFLDFQQSNDTDDDGVVLDNMISAFEGLGVIEICQNGEAVTI